MILFLDTISPFPKFVLFHNNNIIQSIPILDKSNMKISDNIVLKYLIFERKNNFQDKLSKLFVLTGPGSYTSLRLGISFMYGLSISKKIPFFGIPYTSLLSNLIKENDFTKTLLFVCSYNDQNFVCIPIKKEKYLIHKISKDFLCKNIDFNKFTKCIANSKLPKEFEKLFKNQNELLIINIEEIFNNDIFSVFKKEEIIKPIYISDNNLFN